MADARESPEPARLSDSPRPPDFPPSPHARGSRDSLGLLFIGDPHLATRAPGFRRDDYPRASLKKLQWSLAYARQQQLLPILLGDLFHFPRDNANWLLVELLHLFDPAASGVAPLAIAGNHDCRENSLQPDDTLAVLAAAGRLRLLDADEPWIGSINGVSVTIGGTCWGQPLPKTFDRQTRLAFWISHHDLRFPGYEEAGRGGCVEIAGIDAVINGHIHRHLADVVAGGTSWLNPGNLSRVSRGDATRAHVPGVLRIDINGEGWRQQRVDVPHEPFENVFYPDTASAEQGQGTLPEFIRGLQRLQQNKTSDGQGLTQFLDENLPAFAPNVADAIRKLAACVIVEGGSSG